MVADDTEPWRDSEMIDKINEALKKGLERGALETLDLKTKKAVKKGHFIHSFLIQGRNYLLQALQDE